ncbi:MAG: ATP-binding protein [Gammaproteobacteria bacterium]|nr:ATP-binding protein [Gammaproteobacteria bacterium]
MATAKFSVSARTVDMLGRQQIAGIATAISELFKNAHDAYARNVEVDYFRDDGLFVLRDDGLGMTREDFERRWLTLGTESKIGSSTLKLPPIDTNQPKRPILGEKGIGRLAIAVIGSQVLALSRARVGGQPSDSIVAAYLHWGFFELPGLNLDEVEIPLREFSAKNLPGRDEVGEMVEEAATILDRLDSDTNAERIAEIRKQMTRFNVNPREYSEFLGQPSLVNSGCGTHFYILPANTIINDDIDTREADNKATLFERSLIGFTNTMTPGHKEPPIIARFRDYQDEGMPQELIGDRAFFTPDEFENVDHHFHGRFDEYGQFRGTVGIYHMKPDSYILNWSESDGMKTLCGPFKLSFAYMQGMAKDSLLEPREHARLKRKLDRHGGLYIYRDGIRIQPYGDSDYDWLDIERNRTLSAGYYFYSYRRMFGIVELTKASNAMLQEKAGREGFRENKAYRQLRSILMNFFVQTAGDFFRDEGRYADPHTEKKKELNRNEEIRIKKSRQVRQRRKVFETNLEEAFRKIDDQEAEKKCDDILSGLKRHIEHILVSEKPEHLKALAIMRNEKEARIALDELQKDLLVQKPRGVGLSRNLDREWTAYSNHIERLKLEQFRPLEATIEELVSSSAEKAKIPLKDVSRLSAAVENRGESAVKTVRKVSRDIDSMIDYMATEIRSDTSKSLKNINRVVDQVTKRLGELKRESSALYDLTAMRTELVVHIDSVFEAESRKLEGLRAQLEQLREFRSEGYDSVELTEALEEELEELKARRDTDLELAQIGLALNTVSHEFEKSVGSLRRGIKRLEAWADVNPDLEDLYRGLRISFDHLDEYLALFTPLDRRLHRNRIAISGKQIHEFLEKLFHARLKHHDIKLFATDEFMQSLTLCYPSSLYPPFVNMVDNSIFWLQQVRDRSRDIELDADRNGLLIKDNGPGISVRDRENIFQMNFSRKPGGRGMGLHISRETLLREGLELMLDSRTKSEGTVFRISALADQNTSRRIGYE